MNKCVKGSKYDSILILSWKEWHRQLDNHGSHCASTQLLLSITEDCMSSVCLCHGGRRVQPHHPECHNQLSGPSVQLVVKFCTLLQQCHRIHSSLFKASTADVSVVVGQSVLNSSGSGEVVRSWTGCHRLAGWPVVFSTSNAPVAAGMATV
jgi:hypothetical protein